jgi:hypothetical protein
VRRLREISLVFGGLILFVLMVVQTLGKSRTITSLIIHCEQES